MAMKFRELQPRDRSQLKALHEEWFPVKYAEHFYDDVVQGYMGKDRQPVHGIVTVVDNIDNKIEDSNEELSDDIFYDNQEDQIIGACIIQANIESKCLDDNLLDNHLRKKTSNSLFSSINMFGETSPEDQIVYILTLGTDTHYRRSGVAQSLVEKAVSYSKDRKCKAIYLHVITSNEAAIKFYEKNGFVRLRKIDDYYYIGDKKYPCYLYIRYLDEEDDKIEEDNEEMNHWAIVSTSSWWGSIINTPIFTTIKILQLVFGSGNNTVSKIDEFKEIQRPFPTLLIPNSAEDCV